MKSNLTVLAMKKKFAPLALVYLLFLPQPSMADQETDPFPTRYHPDEGSAYDPFSEQTYARNRFLAGERIDERLPSAQDTNGKWGAPTDGLQLSVRLRRREYAPREPVKALVIIRNLRPEPLHSYIERIPCNNFEFLLGRGTNTWKWSKPQPNPDAERERDRSRFPVIIHGHAQTMISVRIDELFPLKELGEYTLQVSRREQSPNHTGFANILSGKATFKIVDQISPSEVAATNAFFKHQQELSSQAEKIRRGRQIANE